jgi:hypothetical protein
MSVFKVNFSLANYKDILPTPPTDYSEILNADKEIEDQFWSKLPYPLIISQEFILQEAKRIKQGVWILIKGVLLWIPGNYYFFLQYWNAAGRPPQFRLKRLKLVYEKIRVRNTPSYIGTYVIKNRKDGETLFSVCDGMWEVIIEEQKHGAIAMQSKTRDTVVGSCWKSLISGWNGLRPWFRDAFFSDFASGNNISEQLKFVRPANEADPSDMGKNVNIVYGPCVHNAFDAYADIIRLLLDEINKWVECHAYAAINNYTNIIMPGGERRGLFDIFSSPADFNGWHNDEAYALWKNSDPAFIDPETGATKSRIKRIYSNPLDGIEGFYDKYGDANPEAILKHILKERENTPKEQRMEKIRSFPLPRWEDGDFETPKEEELFGATESSNIWINLGGIQKRKIEIAKNKPSLVRYGVLNWPQNIPYSGVPVFVQADTMQFNDEDARFCESHSTVSRPEIIDIKTPPKLIQGVIGCDPYNAVNNTKNKLTQSIGAAIAGMFRDYTDPKFVEKPTLIYGARPWHKKIFFDDMVKMCVYTGFMMQYENSDGGAMEDYFRQEEMDSWMLDSRDGKMIETPHGVLQRKGDAPSGQGAKAFTNEIINLIDGYFSLPYNKDEAYLLEEFNFEEVLADVLSFSRENTQFSHFTMALGQYMIGKVKILFNKKRKRDNINNEMLNYSYS